MSMRSIIIAEIEAITREHDKTMPPLTDDTVLMETELDSLCFALLVARMEDRLGVDPFGTMDVGELPVTLGDLVALYERAAVTAAA